jgi:hypothetical protein
MASWRYEDISIGLRDESWRKLSSQDVHAFLSYLSIPEVRSAPLIQQPAKPRRIEPIEALRQIDNMVPVSRAVPTEKLVFNDYAEYAGETDSGWKPLESSFQYLMLCSSGRRLS